ncbi:MAG: hypothetical protein AB8B79_12620 [Granulosicoccus sp.]
MTTSLSKNDSLSKTELLHTPLGFSYRIDGQSIEISADQPGRLMRCVPAESFSDAKP